MTPMYCSLRLDYSIPCFRLTQSFTRRGSTLSSFLLFSLSLFLSLSTCFLVHSSDTGCMQVRDQHRFPLVQIVAGDYDGDPS